MRKMVGIILAFIVIFSLAACTTKGEVTATEATSADTIVNQETGADQAADDQTTLESDTYVVSAAESEVEINESSSDYTWDAADEATITLVDNAINTDSQNVSLSGNVVTIEAPGTYRLSGSLSDGQIVVSATVEGVVRLILDGVNIHNDAGAAIYVEDAEKVIVYLADNTENTLSDGTNYVLTDPESDEPNATLFSKADLTIDGTGSLSVTGNYNDAIASKDGLIINSGVLAVVAADDGIRGKDYVLIRSANITIDANGDGIKSDEADDAAKGWIIIEAGNLNIQAGMDALDAETAVVVESGTLNLTAGDGITNVNFNSDVSMKGIKAGSAVTINGGVVNVYSTDDAIHSNGSILINGGEFNLTSGDDGMHADTELTIENGSITITESYEGLESATITIDDGQITIKASDDGINVAGGADASGMNMDMGGRGGRDGGPGMDMFGGAGDYNLYINGGTIYMNAGGDGLDSNGSITMTGGTVVVNGPTDNGNGPVDYMSSFSISGGTLLAAGSSGMAQAPDGNSTQPALMIFFGTTLSAGTPVSLVDASGANVVTVVPSKEYSSLVISSPDMVLGEMYTLYVGGSVASVDGLGLSSGVATGSTEYSSFTLSYLISQLGTGGGMGGGGGRR
ncbi:MAG: carbohydrate-binding domain-containing protein [Anaerolineaceae bacterium]|nr:carbohydrate-binding domain-containing protein [Anaerolineaceae bacterium]